MKIYFLSQTIQTKGWTMNMYWLWMKPMYFLTVQWFHSEFSFGIHFERKVMDGKLHQDYSIRFSINCYSSHNPFYFRFNCDVPMIYSHLQNTNYTSHELLTWTLFYLSFFVSLFQALFLSHDDSQFERLIA